MPKSGKIQTFHFRNMKFDTFIDFLNSNTRFTLIDVSKRKSSRLNRISQTTSDADPFPKRPGLNTVKVSTLCQKGVFLKRKRAKEKKNRSENRALRRLSQQFR